MYHVLTRGRFKVIEQLLSGGIVGKLGPQPGDGLAVF
jgi:hypothetical protein